MKNLTRSSILLGLGLLTASNFVTVPASAQPHVLKDQRKHDRDDRRDDRRDDDRRHDNRPGWNNGRPGNNDNRPSWNNGRPGNNNNRPGNWNNGRPGNWNNGRPGNTNFLNGYGRPYSSNRDVIFEARVVKNTRGNDFTASNGGRTFRVIALKGEPRGLRVGDTVRLNGRWDFNTLRAGQVHIAR